MKTGYASERERERERERESVKFSLVCVCERERDILSGCSKHVGPCNFSILSSCRV